MNSLIRQNAATDVRDRSCGRVPVGEGVRGFSGWYLTGEFALRATEGGVPPQLGRGRLGQIPSLVTFVAGRGRVQFQNPPRARSREQSRADVESPRAQVPYTAEDKISLPTTMASDALQLKRARCLAAYGAEHPIYRKRDIQ